MWVCVRYGSFVLSKQKLANWALCLPLLINARAESGGLIADPLSSNVLDSLRQIGSFFATRNISEYGCMENYECGVGRSLSREGRQIREQVSAPDVGRVLLGDIYRLSQPSTALLLVRPDQGLQPRYVVSIVHSQWFEIKTPSPYHVDVSGGERSRGVCGTTECRRHHSRTCRRRDVNCSVVFVAV
jgi:hypothetical protein